MGGNKGAKAALRALALDVRSKPVEQADTRAAEAASLGARLLAFTKTDGFRKGATVAALGLTLLGAAKPAMADTVLLDAAGSTEMQRVARELASSRAEDFVSVRPTASALNAVFGAAERGDLQLKHLILNDDTPDRVSVDDWRDLKERFPNAFAAVEYVHVIGPGVSAEPFAGAEAELFPNARAIVGFDVSSDAGAGPASSWVLNETTRAIRGLQQAPLSPQQALIEARRVANSASTRGTTHVRLDGQRHTARRFAIDTTVAADATRVAMPLRRPVGAGQSNHEDDVRVVQQRLSDLGFQVGVDGDFGPTTLKALRTVSALVEGKELVRDASVRVSPGSRLHRCMESESLPRWTAMAETGPGFRNIDADHHDFGWSSVVDVIHGAGQRYQDDYLAANPNASPILTNDVSLRLGGNTPDHASHEVGLDLDMRLPNKSVPGAPTRVGYSSYDRDAARAQIEAFIAEPGVERVLIGDAVLLREFQRSSDPTAAKVQDGGRSHRDHIHVDVAPPTFA